ncbi:MULTISPECIES: HAD family hydrolase [unclassified Mycoplasma]|uniref:Cof-type HAD-IIB family hydrolase n=1 Tax=unclassified Mycoplasma TaxID=2683645 RepID=UPI000FDE7896
MKNKPTKVSQATNTEKRWLIFIDLDGTFLQDSTTGHLNPSDVKAVEQMIKRGHIVCITTGRPWRSTAEIYRKLKLDTVVSNYNGAHIHNPSDYNFQPYITNLNLNDVMYILGDEELQKATRNVAFEGPGWVQLQKRDPHLENVFGFSSAPKFHVGLDFHKLPLKPTGVIVDTNQNVDIRKLLDYLKRRFGDLVEFSSWSKGDGLTPVIDMTRLGATKSKAVSLISRYYKVPVYQTISIGDGYNDIPMFLTTEISVAMANASDDIKSFATWITSKSHKEGGVAEFLELFLADQDGKFVENLRRVRTKKYSARHELNPFHQIHPD